MVQICGKLSVLVASIIGACVTGANAAPTTRVTECNTLRYGPFRLYAVPDNNLDIIYRLKLIEETKTATNTTYFRLSVSLWPAYSQESISLL